MDYTCKCGAWHMSQRAADGLSTVELLYLMDSAHCQQERRALGRFIGSRAVFA